MREAFATAFGAGPDGIWSAPGRVNLIGEHTDYNGGLALPFGIDRRTRVAVRLRDDDVVRVATDSAQARADDGGGVVTATLATAGEATGWSRYLLGAVHVLRRELDVEGMGFDALVWSDVPESVAAAA